MSRFVYKFGGTSVSDLDRINAVAQRVHATYTAGHELVVVLSAMGDETERLIQMAREMNDEPTPREYDALLATGEQISCALLSLALNQMKCPAKSYSGWQVGLKTNSTHRKARIESFGPDLFEENFSKGIVSIVAGFQGINAQGDITTLGRGGSDTTAVAIASVLKAKECQIFTDVDGVYTADPRIVSDARRLDRVTFEEMLELASLGAKVLQTRAVEFARKYSVPLRVCSSFISESSGTLITYEDSNMEQALVSGIAVDRNQAKLTLTGVPQSNDVAYEMMRRVSDANIDVDMIVQNVPNSESRVDISFTVQRDDYDATIAEMKNLCADLPGANVYSDRKVAKLSVVGVGMRSHAGVATKMFAALAKEGIAMHLIATSEIKISVIIDEKYIELGARALHTAFDLSEG